MNNLPTMASKGPEKRSLGKNDGHIAQGRKRVKILKKNASVKTQSQRLQWNTLPVEVRLAILEVVYENNDHDKRRALLATVSLEWRDFFERRNYRHLSLVTKPQTYSHERELSPDIEMLKLGAGGVSARHVPMIRKISLEICLYVYTCGSCEDAGSSHWTGSCGRAFRDALVRLLFHLSSWEYTPPRASPTPSSEAQSGLTLVLTAHTESDAGHWFRNYDFGYGILVQLPWAEYKQGIAGERGYPESSSRRHGYDGQHFQTQSGTPPRGAIFRLFSPLCRALPAATDSPGKIGGKKKASDDVSTLNDESTPADASTVEDPFAMHCAKVPIITSLVIPRETRRYIRGSALSTLWSCLPNLNHIAYEPWRIGRFVSSDWDSPMASVIRSIPSTVNSLAIFEDFSETMTSALLSSSSTNYHRGIALGRAEERFISRQEYEPAKTSTNSGGDSYAASRLPPDPLAEAFVDISRRLEFLSVGYMIDAGRFFAFCKTRIEKETTIAPAPADSESGSANKVEDATKEDDTIVLRGRRIKRRAVTDKWKPEPDEKDKGSPVAPVGYAVKDWRNLKTLILTSPILTDKTKSSEILSLLKDVSLAVRQMPRLEKLVIWYYTEGQACAFTYQSRGRVATVRWCGTWKLQLDQELLEMWRMAVEDPEHRVGGQPAYLRSVASSVLGPGVEIQSHGDAIYHLGLMHDGILEDSSVDQIRREGCIPNRRA